MKKNIIREMIFAIKENGKISNKIINNNLQNNIRINYIMNIINENFAVDYININVIFYILNKKKEYVKSNRKITKIVLKDKKNKSKLFLLKKYVTNIFLRKTEINLNFIYDRNIINGIIINNRLNLMDCSIIHKLNLIKSILK